MADQAITPNDAAGETSERMSDLDLAEALDTIKLKAGGLWLATVGAREVSPNLQPLSWLAHELEECIGKLADAFEIERKLRGERAA
ncbi:MAG: hypothetical protein V9G24_15345 [Rhodoblastus sp.]